MLQRTTRHRERERERDHRIILIGRNRERKREKSINEMKLNNIRSKNRVLKNTPANKWIIVATGCLVGFTGVFAFAF